MTFSRAVSVLLALAILSGISAFSYWLQERFNIDNRQRLSFLKAYLVLTWLAAATSLTLITVNAGTAIGSLLPANETFNRVVSASSAPVLTFENHNELVSQLIVGLYLAGLFITLLRFTRAYIHMKALLANSSSRQIGERSVRTIELAMSPFTFGFFKPQIFMPSLFLTNSRHQEIDVILAHEETHIKNRDPQWNTIFLLTKSFLFFVPTMSYLQRKLELEMEIECDRLTMQRTNINAREYAKILLDAAISIQHLKPQPMFMYMSNANLRGRIQAMKARTHHRPVLSVLFGGLILLASFAAVAATAGASKIKNQYKVNTQIVVDEQVISNATLVVLANESATIQVGGEDPNSSLNMSLIASDSSREEIADGIELKMSIDYKVKDRSFRANPQMVVAPGKDGTITVTSDSNESLEMKIKAVRL